MNKYELAIIFSPNLDEEALKAAFDKVQEYITRFGGKTEKVDDWGKRRLAYPIKKLNEGFYNFITFESEGSAPALIEDRIRIMEDVLRFLIIRQED